METQAIASTSTNELQCSLNATAPANSAVTEKRVRPQRNKPCDQLANLVAPNEIAQGASLQRELRKLHFDNPGEAMIDDAKAMAATKNTSARPKRRVATRPAINKQYRPYHDRLGKLMMANGKGIDLCDCLDVECPGCHPPCRKCSSQKCSFACRNHRNSVVEEWIVPGTKICYRNNYISNAIVEPE